MAKKARWRVTSSEEYPSKREKVVYPFERMRPGDSFLVKWPKLFESYPGISYHAARNRIRSAATHHGNRNGMSFIVRTEPKGIRVWRIGKSERAKEKPIDVELESGVSIPPASRIKMRIPALDKMKVGQSFFVSDAKLAEWYPRAIEPVTGLRAALYVHARQHGTAYTSRRLEDKKGYRIWRVK